MKKFSLKSENKRTELIKKNIVGSFFIRGISVCTSLMLVPLTIDYISKDLYGIWLTITSIIGWISIMDIGFSNGLTNKLTEAIALKNYKLARSLISTTYFFLLIIFIPLGILLSICAQHVDWSSILNAEASQNTMIIKTAQIVLVCFSFQMILKVISCTLRALQRNALSGAIDAIGQILCLIGIFIMTKTMTASLSHMAMIFCVMPLLVLLIASIYFFNYKYRFLRPNIKFVTYKLANNILSLGGKFFIIQIAFIVLYQTTNIIISNVSSPEYVSEYNIAYKYLSIALLVFNLILSPIWNAFTDAYTKKDYTWMKNIYRKLIYLFLFSAMVLIIMLIASPIVYNIWLGDKITIRFSMSLVVMIFLLINIWNSLHSTILNGTGEIKLQLYISLIATFFNIPLAFYLGRLWGANGVVISMIIFSIPSAILLPLQIKGILNKTTSKT